MYFLGELNEQSIFSLLLISFNISVVAKLTEGNSKAFSRKGVYLYKSTDGAQTWQKYKVHKRGRYAGYSDMGLFSDGTIGLLYEAGRQVITNL